MSVDEQRAWFEAWCISEGINAERSTTTGVYSFPSARVAWRAWKAAEAPAIERCAKFMETRADEIAAAGNYTANMMAMVYRDEAKSLRALLTKEES